MRPMRFAKVMIVLAALAASKFASAVPNLISYQGNLNDGSGSPVTSAVSMTFSLYDVSTGGAALWTEIQTVQVSNGLFNVRLGSVAALPATLFGRDEIYLGVKVGADAEMTPRQRLTTAAYSYRAEQLTQPAVPQVSRVLNYMSYDPPGSMSLYDTGHGSGRQKVAYHRRGHCSRVECKHVCRSNRCKDRRAGHPSAHEQHREGRHHATDTTLLATRCCSQPRCRSNRAGGGKSWLSCGDCDRLPP